MMNDVELSSYMTKKGTEPKNVVRDIGRRTHSVSMILKLNNDIGLKEGRHRY